MHQRSRRSRASSWWCRPSSPPASCARWAPATERCSTCCRFPAVAAVEYNVVVVEARLVMVVGTMFVTAIASTLKSGFETLFDSSSLFVGSDSKGSRSNLVKLSRMRGESKRQIATQEATKLMSNNFIGSKQVRSPFWILVPKYMISLSPERATDRRISSSTTHWWSRGTSCESWVCFLSSKSV